MTDGDPMTINHLCDSAKGTWTITSHSQVMSPTPWSSLTSRSLPTQPPAIAEEHESSNAQIRTLLDEQRRTIIAEYCEKVSHHESLAAQAEHDRRTLQEELLPQQTGFSWSSSTRSYKNEGIAKIPKFHLLTRQKFIEDQKTIMELSGRLQELQNEVNCMNDSQDFQDAESVRSGNSHVTSQPGVFPKHPPFGGLLRLDEPPNIWDTSGISRNVFAHPQASSSAPYLQGFNSTWKKTIEEPIHMSTAEKSGRPERDQDLRCQSGPSAKDSVSSVEETIQRIMGQTNNDCRFRISILTSSLRQQPLLAGR